MEGKERKPLTRPWGICVENATENGEILLRRNAEAGMRWNLMKDKILWRNKQHFTVGRFKEVEDRILFLLCI